METEKIIILLVNMQNLFEIPGFQGFVVVFVKNIGFLLIFEQNFRFFRLN